MKPDAVHVGSASLVAAATGLALLPFGVLGATTVVLLKKGDPVNGLLLMASSMLSGVMYPVEVLPAPLQVMAQGLPLTHAIAAFRKAWLFHAAPSALVEHLIPLAGFAMLLLPVSLLLFERSVALARERGTFGNY
jgi:ABC-type multidrug transport system permease subunit